MNWLWSVIRLRPDSRSPDDQQAFKRRQADLEARLDRLAQEVDVMQRGRTDEARAE